MSSANRASVRLAMLPAVVALACACGSGSGAAGGVNDTGTGGTAAGSGGAFSATGGSGASPASGTGGAGTSGAGGTVAGGDSGALGPEDAAVMMGDAGDAPDPHGLYVSPGGDDANPGTRAKPVRTLSKARDLVRDLNANMTRDIHVYLRDGIYDVAATIAFGPLDSGTQGHRIFYEAYPGETPILNGATKVTGWTLSSGNVYKAQLDRKTKLRNLYVNDARASMTSKTVTAQGDYGTYSVTAGQADWAWVTGSNSDGAKYNLPDLPEIASNKDDLEIVNGTTWNENIVCVRDVITTPDNFRALLFQQPYGAIAQLPQWGAGFSNSGQHKIWNAFEFMNGPRQFYFDKTSGTLYYYPKDGEDMQSADVEAPVLDTLIDIEGTSTTGRVTNITFRGITFQNTDYTLYGAGDSHGKATAQGATVYIAYGDGNQHNSKYEILDTLPAMISVSSAESVSFTGNVIKHGGAGGIGFINDVVNSDITGNYIADLATGITIGHPQHVYLGDGGTHAKYPPGVEGTCMNDTIKNNVINDVSMLSGFGGDAAITAFFVDALSITHNHIETTAYNGINLGWGWRNFPDSTTCKNNTVSSNRIIDTLSRLHDSGAIYTIGQMPGTTINQNYVKGIPPATSGPTYGLHNDEGSAYITENDNVLDIDPGVKYTINCEDYGAKHDLTILRTYATVNKMGVDPPMSTIDPPIAVPDNVWAIAQYGTCVSSGIEDAYKSLLPKALIADVDFVFPASCAATLGTDTSLTIRSSGSASNTLWLAPAGTTQFATGAMMTKAAGDATSIALPATAGTYKLHLVDAQGTKLGESQALLRVK